jgi:ankyrin repeat protein
MAKGLTAVGNGTEFPISKITYSAFSKGGRMTRLWPVLIFLIVSGSSCISDSKKGGNSITQPDIDNNEIIIGYVISDNSPQIMKYVKNGGNTNIRDGREWPLLQIAVEHGNTEIVRILVKSGADVNALDPNNRSALMKSSFFGFIDIVKILLEAGADVTLKDNLEETALQKSIYRGHKEVESILKNAGAKE